MKSGVMLATVLIALATGAVVRGAGTLTAPGGAPFRIVAADTVRQGDPVYELVGGVVLEREGVRLGAQRMVYDRSSGRLEAWGGVEITDPTFALACDHLVLATREDEVVAWGGASLRQREDRGEGAFETELTGVQIRLHPKEKRVQVLEDVVLTRFVVEGAERRSVDLRVRCRSLDALSGARQSTFKGDVVVESPTVGARGDRALFDQASGRFYVMGGARAWNFDEGGRPVNVVAGDKIVYVTGQRRTVVVGNVTADVRPDTRTGTRTIPLKPDPATRGDEGVPRE